MMKPLVIYHANCADGFGAAFAAWLKLGNEAEYLPIQYGDTDTHLEYTGRDLYILDFSFPREVMEHMFANAKHVIWLDHHKTALEMWCGKYEKGMQHQSVETPHYINLDDNKSGAYLAWEYFHPSTEIPMLIKHIDDYDRWQFELKGTKEINKAVWSFAPWSFEQWREILTDDNYASMWSQGAAILRAHDQNVQSVVNGSARKCVIYERNSPPTPGLEQWEPDWLINARGLAANCPPHLTSDVGHELAVHSGTFGLCWCLSKEGMTAKCSLRSNEDYDVSAIAKVFGGGGHRNAAGFEVPIQTLLGWLK